MHELEKALDQSTEFIGMFYRQYDTEPLVFSLFFFSNFFCSENARKSGGKVLVHCQMGIVLLSSISCFPLCCLANLPCTFSSFPNAPLHPPPSPSSPPVTAGISRSSSIVLYYFMKHEKMTLQQALWHVKHRYVTGVGQREGLEVAGEDGRKGTETERSEEERRKEKRFQH